MDFSDNRNTRSEKPAGLISYLEEICPLSPAFRKDLEGAVVEEHYVRNEVLHSPSNRSKKIWFIQSGYLYRSSYHGSRRHVDLYPQRILVISYLPGMKPDYYIKLLTDCTLLAIDHNKIIRLKDKHPEVLKLRQGIYIAEIIRLARMAEQAKMPPEERYRIFTGEFPDIFQHASYDFICSCLNIRRDSLIKFRNR